MRTEHAELYRRVAAFPLDEPGADLAFTRRLAQLTGAFNGSCIPIEERAPNEVLSFRGLRVAPPDTDVRNPAFDVTPAELVTGIITDEGVLRDPYGQSLPEAVARREQWRSESPGFAAIAAPAG